jgi:hypothetical protein
VDLIGVFLKEVREERDEGGGARQEEGEVKGREEGMSNIRWHKE